MYHVFIIDIIKIYKNIARINQSIMFSEKKSTKPLDAKTTSFHPKKYIEIITKPIPNNTKYIPKAIRIDHKIHQKLFPEAFMIEYICSIGKKDNHQCFSPNFLLIVYNPHTKGI